MIAVCGDAREPVSMCPGRTGPELGSQLFQLEHFCDFCPDLVSGYMHVPNQPFKPDPGLLSVDDHPELLPYRSLDVDRLRLVGEGTWPMESFLNGPLWLPFQEPAFLCHGMSVPAEAVPNFSAEKPAECLKLARLWDVRGLLHLEPQPLKPGYFSRVFNAYKDQTRDRQIGDRRLPNLSEFHVDGPSKFLPQGRSLVYIRLPRFTHCIRGSITDRRDFYHQAAVTEERARTNMLPFSFPLEDFQGCSALVDFKARFSNKGSVSREVIGDRLGLPKRSRTCVLPSAAFPCFRSLFQGDHLGVEFALRSHEQLLQDAGLLHEERRIRGNMPFPLGSEFEALVIDDYFCLASERLAQDPACGFSWNALDLARKSYDSSGLLGSPEKDVCAASTLKVAGAEIRSCEANVRSGFVPVAAPFHKRLALSMLSLRTSALPGVTAGLFARLLGN